jgi:hypothetical protein
MIIYSSSKKKSEWYFGIFIYYNIMRAFNFKGIAILPYIKSIYSSFKVIGKRVNL